MSEEQIAEKMQAEENKFMMILASLLALVWVILIIIDIAGVLDPSIYFLYGLFNIGAFIFYNRSRNKRASERWIKTTLFEDKEEKKAE
ncbi:hypothetical protein DSAG12_01483 [Promethearchaeum syntrophicum]|uniref:Uncharacterized protein n=1 Tax=Promethearchaeum syntrophicum TaxID=2594042 RepID=A0A5B9DAM9_9ARCH|nr:hypothetical protein [Candidatus Prometheoarchaeum syntrophicum]QEE15656.1 hypothetical protein DSAG12_01483 [Candidatus Prometheoarchaeum syntrophicum]